MADFDNVIDPAEQSRQQTLASEDAIVNALFGSARAAVPVGTVNVPRLQVPDESNPGETKPFAFRVQGVKRAVLDEATRSATRRVRDELAPGMQYREVINQVELEAELVYRATIPEDRARFWDNQRLHEAYRRYAGQDIIPEMLLAGEISSAVLLIFELSGFGSNTATRDKLGN